MVTVKNNACVLLIHTQTSELPTCQVPRSSQQSYPVYSFIPMNFPTDADSDPGISLDDEPMLRTAGMY